MRSNNDADVSPSPPRRRRVVIVGAGIAGLSAARELMERRYDVLVLEARSRPGGRLRTVPMRVPRRTAEREREEAASTMSTKKEHEESVSSSSRTKKAVSSSEAKGGGTIGAGNGEQRMTRGALQREKMEKRRTTRSRSRTSTPTKFGRAANSNAGVTASTCTSTNGSGGRSSSRKGIAAAPSVSEGTRCDPIHPLEQRYSSALFAQENGLAEREFELVPVDLGGAFIHGTGITSSASAGAPSKKNAKLDWTSSSFSSNSRGGKRTARINPLYSLTKKMGVETVALDGCTLYDANGRSVDDVKVSGSSIGAKKKSRRNEWDGDASEESTLDQFVQSKFNEILDDCHDIATRLKRMEREKRSTTVAGKGRKGTTELSTVALPDGSLATCETSFMTVFNSVASSKSIFLNSNSDTLPADLFSWHLEMLEMSCGAPISALGLKWNEDEQFTFDGDHAVPIHGWGKVIEGLADGTGSTRSIETGAVDIRYGVEVSGIGIVSQEHDNVPSKDDYLSDYELSESDEDDVGRDQKEKTVETLSSSASASQPVGKRTRGVRSTSATTTMKQVTSNKKAKTTAEGGASKSKSSSKTAPTKSTTAIRFTRSTSRSKVRRSSRSNIGQNESRYFSPTFESDLKKRKGINPGRKGGDGRSPRKQNSRTISNKFRPGKKHQVSRRPSDSSTTVQVQVKSEDGSTLVYSADHVIVTVPLGVLKIPCGQAGHITFAPPLPQYKRESIQNMGFGHYNKCALSFPMRFWDEEENDDFWGVAGVQCSRIGNNILAYDLGRIHKNSAGAASTNICVMLLIFGGTSARRMESLTDAEVVNEAMTVIKDTWGSKVSDIPSPIDYVVTRWGRDRFSRGSFSYVPPGVDGYVEALKLSRPIFEVTNKGDRRPLIQFAGEHTSANFPSTIHGAYLSGIREAYRLDLTLEPALNRGIVFDRKCVYDRTFDASCKIRSGAPAAQQGNKSKGNLPQPSVGQMDTRSDIAILRGIDTFGRDFATISSTMFPMPCVGDSCRRMTGKGILRRYKELHQQGCNRISTQRVVDDNWLVGLTDNQDVEDFDWGEAAAIETKMIKAGDAA